MNAECNEDVLGPKRDSLYVVLPLTIIFVIIFITGSIGNISTCIVIAKNKSMHTATNYYLFSLAVSDQLLLITGLPQEVYSFWSRYPYIFGSTFCFLRGLLSETSGNSSVLIIGAFTVERYLAICHPFLSHTLSNLSRAIKLVLIIWILSIGLAIPQALPLRVELINGTCRQCVISNNAYIEPVFEVSTILLFIVPMTIITVLYILVGIRLKSSNNINKLSTHARMQRKSSWKVVKMLVAVVVAFFVCWAPFHLQRLTSIYQKPTEETQETHLKIYAMITYISGILYYMSATVNPILYNIMSVKFRDAFRETFSCYWFKEKHVKAQRSHSVASKSNMRYPDSIDSGSQDNSMQSFMLSMHKNSLESTTMTAINNSFMKRMQLEKESLEVEPSKE
ncbi:unnamed protein product [Psylliodes chrysocephalus]|uniref:G-protein coupled receptors family 1 profile domain-containing protein n=1 Tax=Psylliodes chrysocephalus TaxID=3402493 RepID=A0A9P0G6B6_9CUCU|nr:unnamed protein product [Psylliodes chrysocephala]